MSFSFCRTTHYYAIELGMMTHCDIKTDYNWKSKYGGMEANDVKRLKELEEEKRKLKKLFAAVSFENHAMKALFAKKVSDGRVEQPYAQSLKATSLSVIKPCKLISLSQATLYRQLLDWGNKDHETLDAIQARHPFI